MKNARNQIQRFWKWWFTPQSTDPTVLYRERFLRIILPIITILRPIAIIRNYSGAPELPAPYAPLWLAIVFFIVPILFSYFFLIRQKINLAGKSFLLHWYLSDMLSLTSEGYWYPGFQTSLILQIVIATFFLASRNIIPFMVFQLITVGIWGRWLDINYFNPPLLSTGQPVAIFWRSFITLAAQEMIIMFIVRYLRVELEKYLGIQQSNIIQLENEIEKRRQLQNEREKYIDELNLKNAELERFTYTVSHELKTPIVTLKNFIGSVKQDLQNRNYDRANKDFDRISSAADNFYRTISALLELSRIGHVTNPSVEINLTNLLQGVLEVLEYPIESHKVKIHISPNLPVVLADQDRLKEVFQNLIENAVKHMGEQTDPTIEIGAREQAVERVIFVKDNGVGIAPEYHTRIFNLFEKLNPAVEGTGIGLALVKRIVESHGGKIWVESEGLGKGSTFCFTIPS